MKSMEVTMAVFVQSLYGCFYGVGSMFLQLLQQNGGTVGSDSTGGGSSAHID